MIIVTMSCVAHFSEQTAMIRFATIKPTSTIFFLRATVRISARRAVAVSTRNSLNELLGCIYDKASQII